MALEEFYQKVYLDVLYQWIILNQEQYNRDGIICYPQEKEKDCRCIYFETKQIYGRITIWNSDIIEEEIFKKNNDELLFYLHYKMINILQSCNLFKAFYVSLKNQSTIPPRKILLICTGGLTTSLFAQKLQKLIDLEKLNFKVDAVGYGQLESRYHDYDAIYLAPQIAYLEPNAMNITNKQIPIYCITPCTYATSDYRKFLDNMVNHISKHNMA